MSNCLPNIYGCTHRQWKFSVLVRGEVSNSQWRDVWSEEEIGCSALNGHICINPATKAQLTNIRAERT